MVRPYPASGWHGFDCLDQYGLFSFWIRTFLCKADEPGDGRIAPLRVVPMDCYEEMFNEMASKWYGEGTIFQSLGIMELQQSQQTITLKEVGLMNPNYQLVY